MPDHNVSYINTTGEAALPKGAEIRGTKSHRHEMGTNKSQGASAHIQKRMRLDVEQAEVPAPLAGHLVYKTQKEGMPQEPALAEGQVPQLASEASVESQTPSRNEAAGEVPRNANKRKYSTHRKGRVLRLFEGKAQELERLTALNAEQARTIECLTKDGQAAILALAAKEKDLEAAKKLAADGFRVIFFANALEVAQQRVNALETQLAAAQPVLQQAPQIQAAYTALSATCVQLKSERDAARTAASTASAKLRSLELQFQTQGAQLMKEEKAHAQSRGELYKLKRDLFVKDNLLQAACESTIAAQKETEEVQAELSVAKRLAQIVQAKHKPPQNQKPIPSRKSKGLEGAVTTAHPAKEQRDVQMKIPTFNFAELSKIPRYTKSQKRLMEHLNQQQMKEGHRVEGDGNCLFRCISQFVFGDERYHTGMRAVVVKWMKDHSDYVVHENPRHTVQSLVSTDDMEWNNYLDRLKLPGKKGGVSCLAAIAEIFQANVGVVTDFDTDDVRVYAHQFSPIAANAPNTILLSLVKKHFGCLERDPSIVKLPIPNDHSWYCRACKRDNFTVETECHSCGISKIPLPGSWKCGKCTFDNNPTNKKCHVCDEDKK